MQRSVLSTGSRLKLGGWLQLDGLWLGPAAAAVAGILAVGPLHWDSDALIKAASLLLLAELGWGNLWWAVAGTNWDGLRERWQRWPRASFAAGILPYTQADSPGGRLARWWSTLRAWGQAELWPEQGAQLGAILVGVPLALVLGAVLGPAVLLLTLAVMAISQLALFWGADSGGASPFAQAVVEMGIPWLGAGLVFDQLTGSILSAAAALTLAYTGLILIGREKRGGFWLAVGHGVMALTCAALRQPLASAAVGVLYFPQLALLPWLSHRVGGVGDAAGLDGRDALRLAQWPFLAALLLTALAL